MLTLADLPIGRTARVLTTALPQELTQRLAALGLRPDREVAVLRRGWLQGPLQIRVGSTEFMLRRDAARGVHIEAWTAA